MQLPGKTPMRRWLPLAAVIALCCSVQASETETLNTMCPVMTESLANPNLTVVYQGKKVAFCCTRCVELFTADPTKYLANLPQFGGTEPAPGSPPEPAHAPPTPPTQDSAFWGRIHPAIVHFPIAGIPIALLALLLSGYTGKETFARADVPALFVAAAAAVAAFLTGNVAEDAGQFAGEMHEIVERHELAGLLSMILCLTLVLLRVWRWNALRGGWRWAYGAGLVVATLMMLTTGYLGGSLVFGPDHFAF